MDILAICLWSLCLLLLLAVLSFIVLCCYVKYMHVKYDYIPGPPRDSFLLGHAALIQKMTEQQKNPHDMFLQWMEKYGPVVRINAMHIVLIFISSPEAVKELLTTSKYSKDPQTYSKMFHLFGVRFLGTGLVSSLDYYHWHKQRRIMDPAFNRSYLISLMGTFNEVAEHLMEKLEEKADGKTQVSMYNMFARVTLDVITKAAFGMDYSSLDDVQNPFPRAVFLIMKGMLEQFRRPYMKILPKYKQFVQEVKDSVILLRRTGQECIRQRKNAMQKGEEVPQDILTQILKSAELEESIDEEAMVDNFVTFFIAGHETTANQLSSTLMELTRQPEILTRLQAEVDCFVGEKKNLEYEDLRKLQYMSQVLKESLRMYPPIPGTSRTLENSMMLEGIRVPANTTIVFNSYAMGRMEKFFSDPLTFNPDRFAPDAPKPYYCYIPFSLGPRSCIGQAFSQMEAKVILAKLLQRYEFEYVSGQSYEIMDAGTLKPRDGVQCTIKPRTNKYFS
ncbi:cholesterol 24-hydroxylase-like [Protopterus annectens]|uniref:cholesterol 24-hydroxylase-like n=1 Tax=Protopterus annectens TaxID=7888 RepID=UPI001CFA5C9B|nr:cholesterol 24-hydroxylase-like [Protopterus annectens]